MRSTSWLYLWRWCQGVVGTAVLLIWSFGAWLNAEWVAGIPEGYAYTGYGATTGPGLPGGPRAFVVMFLVAIAFGVFVLHRINRARAVPLNEWLAMLVFFACTAPVIAGIGEVMQMGGVTFSYCTKITSLLASKPTAAGSCSWWVGYLTWQQLEFLPVPGVAAVWSYYGMSGLGLPGARSTPAASE